MPQGGDLYRGIGRNPNTRPMTKIVATPGCVAEDCDSSSDISSISDINEVMKPENLVVANVDATTAFSSPESASLPKVSASAAEVSASAATPSIADASDAATVTSSHQKTSDAKDSDAKVSDAKGSSIFGKVGDNQKAGNNLKSLFNLPDPKEKDPLGGLFSKYRQDLPEEAVAPAEKGTPVTVVPEKHRKGTTAKNVSEKKTTTENSGSIFDKTGGSIFDKRTEESGASIFDKKASALGSTTVTTPVTTGSIFTQNPTRASDDEEEESDDDEEDSDDEEEESDDEEAESDGDEEDGSEAEEKEDDGSEAGTEEEDYDSEAEKEGKPPEWFMHMGRELMAAKQWDHALEYLEEVEFPDVRLLLDICMQFNFSHCCCFCKSLYELTFLSHLFYPIGFWERLLIKTIIGSQLM